MLAYRLLVPRSPYTSQSMVCHKRSNPGPSSIAYPPVKPDVSRRNATQSQAASAPASYRSEVHRQEQVSG